MMVTADEPRPVEDEVDSLDAFMMGVTAEVEKCNPKPTVSSKETSMQGSSKPLTMSDTEMTDDEPASKHPEPNFETVDDLLAYGFISYAVYLVCRYVQRQARKKDLLPIDHAAVRYAPFRKAFYIEAPEIRKMSEQELKLLRTELDNIKIRGLKCPKPIKKWSQCGLSTKILDVIKELGYERPTPIQAQAIPAIMSGRDMIGVAKTGSGKTVAFLLPMLRHVMDQPAVQSGEGPIALVMTPTRELAMQIYFECRKFANLLKLRCVCAYGGAPIKEQIADMKRGAEIVICTPGRMIDLLVANSGRVTNLQRITYLVLDEADRMFDMGFGPQIMKIIDNTRPDRQAVLFSATFPRSMEALARKVLHRPLEIVVGMRSTVCEDVTQFIEVIEQDDKFLRLLEILGQWYPEKTKRVLVFVERQDAADDLLRDLMKKGYPCVSLHGGKDQADRDTAISDFKSGIVPVMIATSVAARGLDVKNLGLVINYDCPNHMEDYVHRVGRTGRAGNKGAAFTFIAPEQDKYAPDIVRALLSSKAVIPEPLQKMCDAFLERVRKGLACATGSGFGGKGLEHFEEGREQQKRTQRATHVNEEELSDDGEQKQAETKPTVDSSRALIVDEPPAKKAALPAEARSAIRAAQHAATQISNKVIASGGSTEDIRAPPGSGRLFGQALFKALQRGEIVPIYDTTTPLPAGGEPIPKSYACEIVVNEFSQFVRFTICNKETVQAISEMTGASIIVRGSYTPPGKPQVDRPLYLRVDAESHQNVEAAKRDIIRTLRELLAVDGKNSGTGIELVL